MNQARNAVIAVTKDFLFRAQIQGGQFVHSPQQIFNLSGYGPIEQFLAVCNSVFRSIVH
jgi:hypothetical protein